MKKLIVSSLIAIIVPTLFACNTAIFENVVASRYDGTKNYTYNIATTLLPEFWNPHDTASATNGMPQEYTTSSLYEFGYNADYSSYSINPVMAVGEPKDVTADYIGDEWGINANESGKAFEITLNPDACFEDGLPINAQTYLDSFERLLDRDLLNYRASDYYAGSFVVHNAKNYVYSEKNSDLDERLTDFEKVGIQKVGEYKIVIILDKPLNGFYVLYCFCKNWLVHPTLYDSCKKKDANGVWYSDYGTSVDTYSSYGPYKITAFLPNREMVFEKNDKWFGYKEKYADVFGKFTRGIDETEQMQYQTTKIVVKEVGDISTREQMFLKGQLDVLSLDSITLKNYNKSSELYFNEGETTYYGIISSDYSKLKAAQDVLNGGANKPYIYNKTILCNIKFRKALCYAINRTEMCAALYPAGTAAYGLFSNAIKAIPEQAVSYRKLPTAKRALVEYWGVEYGENRDFKTLDEACNAITGFDLEYARSLIDEAVNDEINACRMNENTTVELVYGAAAYNDSQNRWFTAFRNMFEEIMKGTKLEGKFTYKPNFNLGTNFGDAIRSGAVDTAWGFGWNGGTLDPYGFLRVFVDSATGGEYQYDAWIDRSKIQVIIEIEETFDGAKKSYNYSAADWYKILNGLDKDLPNWSSGKVSDELRAKVLSKIEKAILLDYTTIPMMNEGSVQLKSYKVNFGRENYISGIERGGIRYLTYNLDDDGWNSFVKSQKNATLSYN